MIFNTTEGWQSHRDSASIRASAVMGKVPYFTTAAASAAATRAIAALREGHLEVRSAPVLLFLLAERDPDNPAR